jgi:hypothetical protein
VNAKDLYFVIYFRTLFGFLFLCKIINRYVGHEQEQLEERDHQIHELEQQLEERQRQLCVNRIETNEAVSQVFHVSSLYLAHN